MIRIFFIIGKNKNLIESEIKKLSKNFLFISLKVDESLFFEQLERNLNKNLFGNSPDLVINLTTKLKKESWQRLISLIQENDFQKFIFVLDDQDSEIFEFFKQNKLKFNIISTKLARVDDLIDEFIEKSNINIQKELVSFLKENYRDKIDLLINDLNNINFLDKKEKLTGEEIKNLVHLQINIFKIHDFLLEKKWSAFIHTFKKF
ncbi:MAG: hypothetical protein NZ822_02865, partial [Patescibacteria group bacterium]|nr:hypothetical protein [Patescibacteria group bacterium]